MSRKRNPSGRAVAVVVAVVVVVVVVPVEVGVVVQKVAAAVALVSRVAGVSGAVVAAAVVKRLRDFFEGEPSSALAGVFGYLMIWGGLQGSPSQNGFAATFD